MSTSEAAARRDALIERIRKLQRMTTERGASEGEALAAAAIAARLIAEHEVGMSELEVRADARNCIRDGYVCFRVAQPAWTRVAISIEKLYHTICWIERKHEDVLGLGFETEVLEIVYYGFPLDVAGSIATLAIVAQALEGELLRLPKRLGTLKRQSFELGFCDRVRERLREMRERSTAAHASGTLVLLKDQLVREEWEKLGMKLLRRAAPDREVDREAYAKGKLSGGAVALDTRIAAAGAGRLRHA